MRTAVRDDLEVELLTAPGPPAGLAARWHELAVAAGNPFVLPEWHAGWVATHPADTPFVLVCRERDGEVAGVVPLVRRGRRLAPAGGQLADWFGPACVPGDEERVAHAVAWWLGRTRERWSSLELERCKDGGRWLRGLRQAAVGSPVKVLADRGEDLLSHLDLERDGTGLATGKKARELARLDRRMREAHTVGVRRSDGTAAVPGDLARLFELRAARWGGGFDAGAERFLEAFCASLEQRGLLRFETIDVDGVPAALLLGWRLGARTFAYSAAFDTRYERYGIGIAVMAHAIGSAAAEGATCYDLLRGDEHYKSTFRITSEPVASHLLVRRGSPARLAAEVRTRAHRRYEGLAPPRQELLRRARTAGRRLVALRPG